MKAPLPLDQMTLEEKPSAMEALWEDPCRREDSVPIPEWQKAILDERRLSTEGGKARFLEWESAKKSIAERLP